MAAALSMGAASVVAQKKVFVGGLSWETDEHSLRDYFAKYGPVSDCVIMRDRNTGHPRGFGFVTYDDRVVAERVAAERHELDGRQVEAKMAVPRSECTPTARTHVTRATKKVFVGGLPATCADADFHAYFLRFGEIAECQVMYDHQTGNSRGFGFVTFTSEATVDRVVEMDKHDIMGKLVEVKRAEPKQVLEARRGREAAAALAHTASNSAMLISPQKQPPLPSHTQTHHPAQIAQTQHHLVQHQRSHISPPLNSYMSPAHASPNPQPLDRSSVSTASTTQPAQSLYSTFGPAASPFSSASGSTWNSLLSTSAFASSSFSNPPPASDPLDAALNSSHAEHSSAWRSALGGMGFFSSAQPYSPELAQVVHKAFHNVQTPVEVFADDLAAAVPTQRVERRFHPYSTRERVDRSYR